MKCENLILVFTGEEKLTNGEKAGHLKETKMDIPLVGDRSPSGSQSKIHKQIKKKVPIMSWLPTYNADMAVSDLIAGVTVGLTVIPQGIGYAPLAGLPLQVRGTREAHLFGSGEIGENGAFY